MSFSLPSSKGSWGGGGRKKRVCVPTAQMVACVKRQGQLWPVDLPVGVSSSKPPSPVGLELLPFCLAPAVVKSVLIHPRCQTSMAPSDPATSPACIWRGGHSSGHTFHYPPDLFPELLKYLAISSTCRMAILLPA